MPRLLTTGFLFVCKGKPPMRKTYILYGMPELEGKLPEGIQLFHREVKEVPKRPIKI